MQVSPTTSDRDLYRTAALEDDALRSHTEAYDAVLDVHSNIVRSIPFTAYDVLDLKKNEDQRDIPAWVLVTTHKLLSLSSTTSDTHRGSSKNVVLAKIFRLGMLLFLAPIWRFYGARPTYTEVLVRKFYNLWRTRSIKEDDPQTIQRFQVWALCMCAFEAQATTCADVRRWAVDLLVQSATDGLEPLPEVKSILWLPGLFDIEEATLSREMDKLRNLESVYD